MSAGRVSDARGYSLRWHEPLVLLAGVALGLLVPTLHSATLVRTGSSLGMDATDRAASQILVVVASLAGVLAGGRAVDVWGTRRVAVSGLAAACAGGAGLAAAPTVWAYWAGLLVQSAGVMAAVVGFLASVPVAHLTGRIRHQVAGAFAALAAALIAGVGLALLAEQVGGWRAGESVPVLLCLALFIASLRLHSLTGPPTQVRPAPDRFAVHGVLVVLLGAGLQATPLRNWADAQVVVLLALSLTVLFACACGQWPAWLVRMRIRTPAESSTRRHAPVSAAVTAGGVWGFGQSALATVLLVLLSERGAGQAAGLIAFAGFGAGFVVAGLVCLRRAVSQRTASALGLTLAAVSVSLMSTLPHHQPFLATTMATALAVVVGTGIAMAQVASVTEYLAALPADSRGVTAAAYPAAVVLGSAAISGIPYETVITDATRVATINQLLWITVVVLALAAVLLGRSAVALAVAGAAAVQYVLVTVLSEPRYAQRPLSLAVFVLSGVIVGIAVWIRGRQSERLARTVAGATALQQAVLRHPPAFVGDLRLACLYLPATTDSGIGGDFYDVARTDHTTRILLGDVRGKGLDALGIVNDVLGCFRSRVHDTPDLTELATHLDRHIARTAAARDDTELFATALLLEHHDHSDEVRIFNCGHLPPVLLTHQRAEEVDLPVLLPLGFAALDQQLGPAPTSVSLQPGAVLLLATDGLSEARNASGDFYPLLPRLLHIPDGDLPTLLRSLVADAQQWTHRLTDDIALIAITPRGSP
ncbi:PP2C family protein-serine/threonine phosphatase [Streptomyces sp. NPDC088788]|uniref:PP2C family protein-serine/threonine phosphatase n=1 Tax=Streptomyces sp. NPDC088788 TaxID=3365898 RepID=UPI00381CB245